MKKEVVVFLVTLALLAGLWFLSTKDNTPTGRGGKPRGEQAHNPVAARSTPGHFLPDTEVTWAPNASNIFETPTETRDLPPLDLVPPPFPRLVHPGPTLPVPIGIKARGGLRRLIVPVKVASAGDGSGGGGAPSSGGSGSGSGDAAGGNATNPAPSQGPLVPLGKELSAVDRANLSIEAELEREKQKRIAQESEEDRKKRLDKLTFANQSIEYGELAAPKGENRYAVKQAFEKLRTDPSLTEPERNDRLKKLTILFRTDKRGKLGKPTPYPADQIVGITLADSPENRYRMQMLDANPKDLAQQLELAKLVFDARLFPLAVDHLTQMRKNGLQSPEMLIMLADAQHEVFAYNDEIEVLRAGVAAFPDSAPLLSRLGRLQVKVGVPFEAKKSFMEALAKNPSEPMANAGMGELLMKSGEPQKAIQHLREALNLAGSDPLKVDAMRLMLAEAYLRLGDFRNAHEAVDLVLQRTNVAAPERAHVNERAFALSAMAALGQNQLAEARTRTEEGSKRYPLSGQLSYLLGIIMAEQGEFDPARTRLLAAIELDPLLTGHADAAIAMVDEAQARDDAAVASAETGALVANPMALELRLPFGRALAHVGDIAKAREQLLIALDFEPSSADALAALGDVNYVDVAGTLNEASRFYDRAAAMDPNYPQLLARRLIAAVRRRKLAEAEELNAKVTTADLKDPFMQAAQAFFQYTKGNQAEALNILQKLGETPSAGLLADYGKDAHAKIEAHQNKTLWTDSFARTGATIGREWKRVHASGPVISFKGTALSFEGQQRAVSDEPTILWQERAGEKVYGFSVDLDMTPQPGVYMGTGLMVFNTGVRAPTVKWPGMPDPKDHGGGIAYTGIQVALSPDAKLVYRVLNKGAMTEWADVPVTTYTGGPVTIELRLSDPKEGEVTVLVNREAVLRQTLPDLKRFRRAVELQIFCQAQADRKVSFTADNVAIVTLKN